MTSITLKNVPDELLERLRKLARAQRRSLNQQALFLLEAALREPAEQSDQDVAAQVEAWRRLAGGWRDTPPTEEEVADIYAARTRGREVDL